MPYNDLLLSLVSLITDERIFGHWGLFGSSQDFFEHAFKTEYHTYNILIFHISSFLYSVFQILNFFSFFLASSHTYIVFMCRKMQLRQCLLFPAGGTIYYNCKQTYKKEAGMGGSLSMNSMNSRQLALRKCWVLQRIWEFKKWSWKGIPLSLWMLLRSGK